jgi:hypothetical protein
MFVSRCFVPVERLDTADQEAVKEIDRLQNSLRDDHRSLLAALAKPKSPAMDSVVRVRVIRPTDALPVTNASERRSIRLEPGQTFNVLEDRGTQLEISVGGEPRLVNKRDVGAAQSPAPLSDSDSLDASGREVGDPRGRAQRGSI